MKKLLGDIDEARNKIEDKIFCAVTCVFIILKMRAIYNIIARIL